MCNLHIHAVIDSDWMSQRALSQAWHEITGDSFIVDISSVKSSHQAIDYMSKHLAFDYMTKHLSKIPGDVPAWQYDLINEVLGDVRLVQGFGTLARLGLSIRDPVCPFCGALATTLCIDFEPCYSDMSGGLEPKRHLAIAIEGCSHV